MRKPYRVSPYSSTDRPKLKFVVSSHVAGKRERKFFETKKEADTYAQLRQVELLNQGKEGAAFPTELRVLAQRADALLKPFGRSIMDAAEFYAKHLRTITTSKTVAEVAAEYLARCVKSKKRPDYIADLRRKFTAFGERFGDQMIAAVRKEDVRDWLRGLDLEPGTFNTMRSRLVSLFTFAGDEGYLGEDPKNHAEAVPLEEEASSRRDFLEVDKVERLLNRASSDVLPYWLLAAFCGIRSAELERMTWDCVNFEDNEVCVFEDESKTGVSRTIPIRDNLRAWLKPYVGHKGPICTANHRRKAEADRERAGLLDDFPRNCLRHSFATYALRTLGSAEKLALEMGNSRKLILERYANRGIRSRDAERYWALMPSDVSGKIVSISAA